MQYMAVPIWRVVPALTTQDSTRDDSEGDSSGHFFDLESGG